MYSQGFKDTQSTLSKSKSQKSNNCLSRRSIQILLSLFSIGFRPHISGIFSKSKLFLQSQGIRLRQSWLYQFLYIIVVNISTLYHLFNHIYIHTKYLSIFFLKRNHHNIIVQVNNNFSSLYIDTEKDNNNLDNLNTTAPPVGGNYQHNVLSNPLFLGI